MAVKAISLISGGLDSTLATKMILDQGVDVVAVNFVSPFCRFDEKDSCRREAKFVAEELQVPFKIVKLEEEFLEIVRAPKHGYGSNMNPCIDCRILMLKKAKEVMRELGASFIITGEVVGQRPMSQKKNIMRMVLKEADAVGIVLRPLSAKLLEPTMPEEKGWVDRNKLLEIDGRGRKVQMEMAENFNIKDYPCPAGGCLLTDPAFSKRVKDLVRHKNLTLDSAEKLKYGRQFRLSEDAKIIVGRNESDNEKLSSLVSDPDVFFAPEEEVSGASGLGCGNFNDREVVLLAARIVARYFDKQKDASCARVVVSTKGRHEILEVEPFSDVEAKKYLI